MVWELREGLIDGDGSGEYFQFPELIVSVVFNIFSIGGFEEGNLLFKSSPFLKESFFPVDLLNLFRLEIVLLL